MHIDTSKPVLVTGATGYVAGWVVYKLLEKGLTVHCAVRDPDNQEKLKYLLESEQNLPGKIIFFKTDLLEQGSYAEAMQGCQVVFHTASPFTINVKDPQKDLVDPAVLGTRNVLEQANQIPSVTRIVLTSSVASVHGDNADVADAPNNILTEEQWNTSSSLDHQAYSYSKVLAEKEGWKICNQQSQWDMVTINPSLVIGPGLNPKGTSESFRVIKQIVNGTMRTGAANWEFGMVDVRDVAEAHIQAAFRPEAKGRYIICNEVKNFLDIANALRPKYGKKLPMPTSNLPKAMIWLFGPFLSPGLTRKMISKNIDIPLKLDNSKAIKELELNYIPFAKSATEFVDQMIEAGYVRVKS